MLLAVCREEEVMRYYLEGWAAWSLFVRDTGSIVSSDGYIPIENYMEFIVEKL